MDEFVERILATKACITAWALAAMNPLDAWLFASDKLRFAALAREAERCLGKFKPQGLVNVAWVFVVAVNLLALLSAIVLIQEGLKRGLTQYFYSGIVLILLLALMRYLDLFGDYLGAAAMFLVAAAVLYGAARFWRRQQNQEAVSKTAAGEGQS